MHVIYTRVFLSFFSLQYYRTEEEAMRVFLRCRYFFSIFISLISYQRVVNPFVSESSFLDNERTRFDCSLVKVHKDIVSSFICNLRPYSRFLSSYFDQIHFSARTRDECFIEFSFRRSKLSYCIHLHRRYIYIITYVISYVFAAYMLRIKKYRKRTLKIITHTLITFFTKRKVEEMN